MRHAVIMTVLGGWPEATAYFNTHQAQEEYDEKFGSSFYVFAHTYIFSNRKDTPAPQKAV